MSNNQKKLLLDLAKKIESAPKDRARIVTSLKNAKILTKNGNFTAHYANLNKVVSSAD